MISVRKSQERGYFQHGWLETYHTFSFGDYYDPAHTEFGVLRVINEDWIAPGKGFGKHPHANMEIVTYVIDGVLKHTDSLGHETFLKSGGVQRMSAGRGVYHSEMNGSNETAVHLLQIWIYPEQKELPPSHEEKSFPESELCLIVSKAGVDGSLKIHQDVKIFASRPKRKLSYDLLPSRSAWIQVINGPIVCNGTKLSSGDGASIQNEKRLELEGGHFLLFDLPV